MRFGVAVDRLAFPALIGLVLAGLMFLLFSTGTGNYVLDDAYIIDHAVAGMYSGNESRFVGSTPWQGVTSPAYVAAVAFLSLILSIEAAHWTVGALSLLLLASGWYVLCRRTSSGGLMAVGIVLTSLMAGMTLFHVANGLETGLAMAALTWTLIALDDEPTPAWGYALLGILCFIRPELAALSVVCIVYLSAKRAVWWSKGLLVSVAAFLISVLLLLVTTSTVVPNTLSAKAYFFLEGCKPALYRTLSLCSALWTFISGLGLFAVGFLMAAASRLRIVIVCFVVLFFSAYFFTFPGALSHNYSRYLYLLFPIAVLGWATCLGHRSRMIRYASMMIGSLVACLVMLSANSSINFYREQVRIFSKDNSEMANWVASHVPKEAVVMVHDAGKISRIGEQPLVDLVGLKSPYSTEIHRRANYDGCERMPSAISEIARHAGASYMVVTKDWDKVFGLTDSLRSAGWMVERVDLERGNSHYKVYRIFDSMKKSKAVTE